MCNSKMRFVALLAAFASLTGLGLAGAARAFEDFAGRLGPEKLAHMRFELELTDEQVEKLQDIFLESARKLIPKRGELQLARLELGAMKSEPDPDRKKVEDQVRKMGALRTEVQLFQTMRQLDVLTVLTPEQRKKLQRHFIPGDRGWGHGGRGPEMPERMERRRMERMRGMGGMMENPEED